MKTIFVVLLVASIALAGCGGKKGDDGDGKKTELKEGKGAITGVVLDDVIRPVPKALVLLCNGETVEADGSGQFEFINLEPGAYVLRATADNHEAAPLTV